MNAIVVHEGVRNAIKREVGGGGAKKKKKSPAPESQLL